MDAMSKCVEKEQKGTPREIMEGRTYQGTRSRPSDTRIKTAALRIKQKRHRMNLNVK